MAERRREPEALPTIWRVPDAVWAKVAILVDKFDPPKRTGRRRAAELACRCAATMAKRQEPARSGRSKLSACGHVASDRYRVPDP